MITKLDKNSELLKLCQDGTNCKECDAKNEFDCVAQLIYTYNMYCFDALEKINAQEKEDVEFKK